MKEGGSPKNNVFLVIAIVLAVLAVFGIFANIGSGGDGNDNSSYNDDDMDAWICAKNVVESNLKSPSTAKFPIYSSKYVTSLGSSKYTVHAYVDAQNSFGATIRKNFTVTLTLTGSGYKDGFCVFD